MDIWVKDLEIPKGYPLSHNLLWVRVSADSIAEVGLEMTREAECMLLKSVGQLVWQKFIAPRVYKASFRVYDRDNNKHDFILSGNIPSDRYVLSGDLTNFIRYYGLDGKDIFIAFYIENPYVRTSIRMERLDVNDLSFVDAANVSIEIEENMLLDNSLSVESDQVVLLVKYLRSMHSDLQKGSWVLFVYDIDYDAYNLVLTCDGRGKCLFTNDWNKLLKKYNIRAGSTVSFIKKSKGDYAFCCYFVDVSGGMTSDGNVADPGIGSGDSSGIGGSEIGRSGGGSGIGSSGIGSSGAGIDTSGAGPSVLYEGDEHLRKSAGHIYRLNENQYVPDLRSGIGSASVKNLSDSTDCVELQELVQQFGTILSCKVATSTDGKSKGFGFDQFESESSAKDVIEKLDGSSNDEKQLFVGKFVKKSDRAITSNLEKYTNLFVKNLDKGISEESLEEKFSVYGKVVSVSVTKDENNASRGFGFVNFENPDDAKRALEALHGSELGSKVLYVARAQKKSEREEILRRQFVEKKKERLMKYQASNVYVKNIDDGVKDDELKKYFSNCGTVTSAKIVRNQKGVSKGFGFVCFSTPEEANKAVYAFHGFILRGKPLYVAIAQKKEERQAQLQLIYAQRAQGLAGPSAVIPGGHSHFYYPASGVVSQIPAQAAAIYQPTGMRPGWRHNGGVPSIFRPRVHPSLGTSAPHNPRQYRQNGGRMNGVGFPQGAALPHTSRWQQPKDSRNHQNNVSAEGLGKISSLVAAAPPEHQKHILGEHLFPLVADHQPDLATKITGMLLEMDNSELLHLLDSPEALAAKVEEGVELLKLSKSKVSNHDSLPSKYVSTRVAHN